MKLFLILFGMAAAGILGYMKEPSLRFSLTGISPGDANSNPAQQAPADAGQATGPAIDLSTLTPAQLPEKVTIRADIKFSDDTSGLTMTVSSGSRVKLVRIDGTDAVVRPGDTPYSIVLPIEKTDLMEQLAANPPAAVPAPEPAPVVPEPAPEPKPEPAPEPAPTPAGDSQEPAPMPEPAAEPKPEPAPAPEPAPEPAPAPAPAAVSTDVVKIMQESIRGGQVKEFKFEQVLGWEPGPNETVDGEAFQTGNVSYKAETIFGVKNIQAKALIKEGKVLRWIWPKSGMEIK